MCDCPVNCDVRGSCFAKYLNGCYAAEYTLNCFNINYNIAWVLNNDYAGDIMTANKDMIPALMDKLENDDVFDGYISKLKKTSHVDTQSLLDNVKKELVIYLKDDCYCALCGDEIEGECSGKCKKCVCRDCKIEIRREMSYW